MNTNNQHRVRVSRRNKVFENKIKEDQISWYEKIFKSEAFILASIPVICYIFNYSYWFGYFTFFRIPINLIGFDLVQCLNTFIDFLPITLSIFFPYLYFKTYSSAMEWESRIKAAILFFFLFISMYYMTIKDYFSLSIFWCIILVFYLVKKLQTFILRNYFNLVFHNSIEEPLKFHQKFSKALLDLDIRFFQKKWDLKKKILNKIMLYINDYKSRMHSDIDLIYVYIVVFLGITFFIQMIGEIQASKQSEYSVYKMKNGECLVEYMTSSIAICGNFDRVSKKILNSYQIIQVTNLADGNMEVENLGPFIK